MTRTKQTAVTQMSSENPPERLADSLLNRLAGPSSGKAGSVLNSFTFNAVYSRTLRLAKDQTEINRIISEVSKGSKFYEVRTLLKRTLHID